MLGDDRAPWEFMPQAYFAEELVPLFFAEDPSESLVPPGGVYWLSPIFRDLLLTSSHLAEGKGTVFVECRRARFLMVSYSIRSRQPPFFRATGKG